MNIHERMLEEECRHLRVLYVLWRLCPTWDKDLWDMITRSQRAVDDLTRLVETEKNRGKYVFAKERIDYLIKR